MSGFLVHFVPVNTFFPLGNFCYLVFPFKEISIQPELSSPPYFRIQEGVPERDGRTSKGQKSLCIILDSKNIYQWGMVKNSSEFREVWGIVSAICNKNGSLLSCMQSKLAASVIWKTFSLTNFEDNNISQLIYLFYPKELIDIFLIQFF